MIPLLCAWIAVRVLAVPMTAQQTTALLMLAASVLVFRTFRERFLLVWILGWLAYGISGWFGPDSPWFPPSPELLAISQAAFVMTVCLFAAAILVYTCAE